MTEKKCSTCEAPNRSLWPPNLSPKFDEVESGNWISLEKCANCDALWTTVPYEPHSMFYYSVFWSWGIDTWKLVHDHDDARTLHNWHKASICKFGPGLSGKDKEAIDWHCERSSGLEPYGNCDEFNEGNPNDMITTIKENRRDQ